MNKRILLLPIFLLLCTFGAAQEKTMKFSAGAHLNSAYLWRGEKVCGVHWMPELGVRAGNLEFLFYGYLPFDKSYKELDLELVYHIGDVSLHLGDYYFHIPGTGHKDNWFDWSKEGAGHVLEGALCYIPEHLPFHAKWFTFIRGRYLPDGTPAVSSYLELEGHHNFSDVCKVALEAGFSIRKDSYTAFREDFAFVHCALKVSHEFKTGAATFPITATCLYNPYYDATFFGLCAGMRF